MKITDTKIDKELKAPPEGNHIEWDDKIPGFGVRITAKGVISFVLSYRFKGKKHRDTIARYDKQAVNDDHYMNAEDARSKALDLQKGIRNGIDPMDPEPETKSTKPGETTFSGLAAQYLEHAE